MSNKTKKQQMQTKENMTETQKHIMELRKTLNAPDPNEIHPFTLYKILTYLCVVIAPLVPVALYRIWCAKTTFSPKEQKIWTAVIVAIALYMVSFALQ